MRFLLLLLISTSVFAQKKLYYFSGSDWCAPCIKFKKEVISSEDFKGVVSTLNIEFEILDFPQRKKGLSKAYQKHCDSLANLYNVEGSFPKLIKVDESKVKVYNHKLSLEALLKEFKTDFKDEFEKITSTRAAMGSVFNLEIKTSSENQINKAWQVINELEQGISSWDSTSITFEVNKYSGVQPVKVPVDYYEMVKACITLSKITQGAFDITVKPALKIWNWKRGEVASDEQIEKVKNLVGSEKIILNDIDTTIYLPLKGMSLDFGAFGKGMAADLVVETWTTNKFIKSGIIDAGGDLRIYGPEKEVVIPNPLKPKEILYTLKIANAAIVTSGDYVRNFEKEGVKYSHIIDPRSCRPVSNGISSVTIIAQTGSLADGLATAIIVLGQEVGLDLINQLNDVEAIIVNSSGAEYFSAGMKLLLD